MPKFHVPQVSAILYLNIKSSLYLRYKIIIEMLASSFQLSMVLIDNINPECYLNYILLGFGGHRIVVVSSQS